MIIIHHQNNRAAFARNRTWLWIGQPLLHPRISVTSAAAANNLIEQARGIARFTFTRVFGRVN